MKVFASFVTYNPDQERFCKALESVRGQVEKVIVVDNTKHNEGIARALNKAFEQAEAEGCDWLITFDQDSLAPEGLVARLLDDIKNLDDVGQIGPAYTNYKVKGTDVVEEDHIITSGSLTSVAAWRKVGGFRDDYFIDCVDIEFSLRLRKNGYKVLMDCGICLDHCLGNGLKGIYLFGKKRWQYVEHPPIRLYYIVRNAFCMRKEYDDVFPKATGRIVNNVLKKICRMLLSGSDRSAKFSMAYRGWKDYRSGRMGMYSE